MMFYIGIGGGLGKGRISESDLLMGSIKDSVESLKDRLAEDEFILYKFAQARVINNRENVIGTSTSNKCIVKVSRPDLSVRSEF